MGVWPLAVPSPLLSPEECPGRGQTHKLLRAREVEELHQPEVVPGDDVQAGVGDTRAVHVGLVCVPRPDADDLVSQDAVPGGREARRRKEVDPNPAP